MYLLEIIMEEIDQSRIIIDENTNSGLIAICDSDLQCKLHQSS